MSLRELKEFCTPEGPEEVVALLDKYGDRALILAGGTFVHSLEARGLLSELQALIDIRKLGLGKIQANGGLRLGATATFGALGQTEAVQDDGAWGALVDALVYPPAQIKNVATVGGSIAASSPFFDLPIAFSALDGVVIAHGRGGARKLALSDFFVGLFENALEPGEYVTELVLPPPPQGTASAFTKLDGNANDLAIVNAAVRITVAGGKCKDARVVLGGGCGDRPVRSASAEKVLEGAELGGDEVLREAGEAVATDIDPMSDHRASAKYRKAVAKVMVQRALARAVARLS
jgi:CO/xanthine dehydrogenase FAD-binding subunit